MIELLVILAAVYFYKKAPAAAASSTTSSSPPIVSTTNSPDTGSLTSAILGTGLGSNGGNPTDVTPILRPIGGRFVGGPDADPVKITDPLVILGTTRSISPTGGGYGGGAVPVVGYKHTTPVLWQGARATSRGLGGPGNVDGTTDEAFRVMDMM